MKSFRKLLAESVARFHLEKLHEIFCYSGLGNIWYRMTCKEQVKEDVRYYSNPDIQKRIEQILAKLSDEESRITYEKVIRFRQYHYGKDRPHFTKPQYFIKELGKSRDEEVFIDGGGYIGDTYKEFLKWSHSHYERYIFFEPGTVNFEKFKATTNDKRVCFKNLGLWNKQTNLYFTGGTSGAERIIEDEEQGNNVSLERVPVTAIDLVPECEKATFIKMDIEGSEMKALEGAVNTIKNNRPKLAICIYHSNEDMLRIPEWCFENLERYSFYIRHHHYLPCDTVFYAIPEEMISKQEA